MGRLIRLGVAAVVTLLIASTVVALELGAQPLAITSPARTASNGPTPSPIEGLGYGPAPTKTEADTPRPTTTCRVLRTPEPMEPPHAQVNGQPSLGVPTRSGVIVVEIAECRDIQAILAKYGLAGPATRYIDVLESDETIANGATRWYRIGVTPGTESATVVELYQHPEDIEYVQLLPEFTGGGAGG